MLKSLQMFLAWVIFLLAALGGPGCAQVDPLVGSWSLLGAPAGTTAAYAFRLDGTVTFSGGSTDGSTGCRYGAVGGGTWTATADVLTVAPSPFTWATTGCADPTQDVPPLTTIPTVAVVDVRYAVDGDALTLVDDPFACHGPVTYAREGGR